MPKDLPLPPDYDPMVETEEGENHGKISQSWQAFMRDATSKIQDHLPSSRLSLARSPVTTAQRDALGNVQNGDVVYNVDTDKFNFREGGVWVEFT